MGGNLVTEEVYARLATSQLKHVLIALEDDDRDFNMRDVLDPWWCYRRGGLFVSPKRTGGYADRQINAPCAVGKRSLLEAIGNCSDAAKLVIERRVSRNKATPPEDCLIVDHTIPLRVIEKELRNRVDLWTIEALRSYLESNMIRSVLTLAEHNALASRGWESEMPAGWSSGSNPFMRYDLASINGTWTAARS